ncbi:hypothetical protein [Ferrimonas kyonanensis]|uniref:hypothetical protein n=1 Tax=Ferrimonas kyonanensis TaxID=364763 RepID=UPI000488F8EA|nr:hypothetical protein [Ferrimonas kyonanensis]
MSSSDSDIKIRIVTSAVLHYRISLLDGSTAPGRTAGNRHIVSWLKQAQKSRRFGLAGKVTLDALLAHAVKNRFMVSLIDELEALVVPGRAKPGNGAEKPALLRLKEAGESLVERGYTVQIPFAHDFKTGMPDLPVPSALVLAEDMVCFDDSGALTEEISLVTVTEGEPDGVIELFQQFGLSLQHRAEAKPQGCVQTEYRLTTASEA